MTVAQGLMDDIDKFIMVLCDDDLIEEIVDNARVKRINDGDWRNEALSAIVVRQGINEYRDLILNKCGLTVESLGEVVK